MKINNKIILSFLIISSLFFNCKKEEKETTKQYHYLYYGYIIDTINNIAIANQKVELTNSDPFGLDGAGSPIYTFKTDSNGYFLINTTEYYYLNYIRFSNDYLSPISWGIQLEQADSNLGNIYVEAFGRLNIHYNLDTIGVTTDSLNITINNESVFIYRPNYQDVQVNKGYNYISWTLNTSSGIISHEDSVYCELFSTTSFDLYY